MRHQRSRLRLKQKPAHAKMLERNLVTSLLLYESIRTTKKRAKVIQPTVDKLIQYAKSHPPHVAIRYVNRVVTDKNASKKIMEVYCKRYADRGSGLSRAVPVGVRVGDGAELVDLTLIDAVIGEPVVEEKKPKKTEKKAPVAKKVEAPKKAPAKKKADSDKKSS
jgi:large subunit ribosomal protein L17